MHISVRVFSQGPNAPMFGAQRLVGPLLLGGYFPDFRVRNNKLSLQGFLLIASGQSTVPHTVVVESRSLYTYSRFNLSVFLVSTPTFFVQRLLHWQNTVGPSFSVPHASPLDARHCALLSTASAEAAAASRTNPSGTPGAVGICSAERTRV